MRLISAPACGARRIKHHMAIMTRRARRAGGDAWSHLRPRLRPYRYDARRDEDRNGFPPFDHFLHREPRDGQVLEGAEAPSTVWCFWTGPNALTPNRARSIQALEAAYGEAGFRLVTDDILPSITVPGHPLHPAYDLLSFVHRSDYLRAYVLHHHGGAYTDLKTPGNGSLIQPLQRLQEDKHLWVVGAPDPDHRLVGNLHGPLGDDTRTHRSVLVGIHAMACRPRTPFTAEWLNEVERRLDYYHRDLRSHPARDPYGREGGYPITWIGIGADVYQPLQLKYLNHVEVDRTLRVVTSDYR